MRYRSSAAPRGRPPRRPRSRSARRGSRTGPPPGRLRVGPGHPGRHRDIVAGARRRAPRPSAPAPRRCTMSSMKEHDGHSSSLPPQARTTGPPIAATSIRAPAGNSMSPSFRHAGLSGCPAQGPGGDRVVGEAADEVAGPDRGEGAGDQLRVLCGEPQRELATSGDPEGEDRVGVDLGLPVQPLRGRRGPGRRARSPAPSADRARRSTHREGGVAHARDPAGGRRRRLQAALGPAQHSAAGSGAPRVSAGRT